MSDDEQTTSSVSSIFNAEDADFIIKSADNKTFKVHRVCLTAASDVFKTMLSVPQPSYTPLQDIPSVDLTESGVVLELLYVLHDARSLSISGGSQRTNALPSLQFIYPMKSPSHLSFNQYAEVLEVASKYAIEGTIDALRILLLSPRIDSARGSTQVKPCLAESDPLRAYAIATSMGWKAEAIHASNLSLRINLNQSTSSTELDNMPTKLYRWLVELHDERRAFFKRLFEEFDDDPSEYRLKKCKECGMDPLRLWWDDYIQRASTSVQSRPLGDRVFDLCTLFPPDEDIDSYGCMACPSPTVPLQTLYALSNLKQKLSKKKDSVRQKYSNPSQPGNMNH